MSKSAIVEMFDEFSFLEGKEAELVVDLAAATEKRQRIVAELAALRTRQAQLVARIKAAVAALG